MKHIASRQIDVADSKLWFVVISRSSVIYDGCALPVLPLTGPLQYLSRSLSDFDEIWNPDANFDYENSH